MIRCLSSKVLLFPVPQIMRSPGGIEYPDNYRIGDTVNQRFWVAAIGPKVPEGLLAVEDHVICPAPTEDHPRLEGGARVLDYKYIIAKLEKPNEPANTD